MANIPYWLAIDIPGWHPTHVKYMCGKHRTYRTFKWRVYKQQQTNPAYYAFKVSKQ